MKKAKILMVFLIIMALVLGFSAVAYGAEPDTSGAGEPITTSENEDTPVVTDDDGHNHEVIDPSTIHQGDLYVASDEKEYTMDKLVNGNVFIFGKTVKITGR